MIIQDGTLNDQIYQKKSHRTTSHYRTFLIQTQDKKAVFGITTQKFSLADLGQKLQQIYSNQTISVVNLDGGSSTSLSAT
jgi:exopolysaccharide biosynthesis protein